LWAQYSQVIRPPQQKPVIPSLLILPPFFGPRHAGVEVAHHLRVRGLRDDVLDEVGNICLLADVALTHEQIGGQRQVALLGEAARHVGDVFVHAEDFRDHEDDRQVGLAGRPGAIDGNALAVHLQGDRAGREARFIGLDHRLSRHRQRGGRKAAAQCRLQEYATADAVREGGIGNQTAAIEYEIFHVHPSGQ